MLLLAWLRGQATQRAAVVSHTLPFGPLGHFGRVASVFRITNLDSVFRVFPTVEGALQAAEISQEDDTSER